jgi:hypothetical protein
MNDEWRGKGERENAEGAEGAEGAEDAVKIMISA